MLSLDSISIFAKMVPTQLRYLFVEKSVEMIGQSWLMALVLL